MPRLRFTRIPEGLEEAAIRYVDRLLALASSADDLRLKLSGAKARWAHAKAEMEPLEPLAQGLLISEWVDESLGEDARARFHSAIRQHASRGRTSAKQKVRVVLELDPAEARRLKVIAVDEGVSLSVLVAALARYAHGTKGWRHMVRRPRGT